MNEENDDLLNLILENPITEALEPGPVISEVTNNINLLDEIEKSPDNIKTPGMLLEEYTNKDKENMHIQVEIDDFKQKHLEVFEEYQALLDKFNDNIARQNSLKEELTKSMGESKLKTVANEIFKVTYVAPTTKTTFDRKKFEAKYPVLCKQFLKTSDVSAYVKISEVK